MNKETKKLKDLVFSSIDSIENACKVALKDFETNEMSIQVYFSFLDKAKWKIKAKDRLRNKHIADYANNYNMMLEAIKDSILKSGHLKITMEAITSINGTIKKSFMDGVNAK